MKQKPNFGISTFRVLIIFTMLSFAGSAAIPLLNISMDPAFSFPGVYITIGWDDKDVISVEQEVTSRLEGAIKTLPGIERINSWSQKGRGSMFVRLQKESNVNIFRYSVGMALKDLQKHLPEGVDAPYVWAGVNNGTNNVTLMVYQLSGEENKDKLAERLEKGLKPVLEGVKDVADVQVRYGKSSKWVLSYDSEYLNSVGVKTADIQRAVQQYISSMVLGRVRFDENKSDRMAVRLSFKEQRNVDWNQIWIAHESGRMIPLTELVKVNSEEVENDEVYHINGKEVVSLVVSISQDVNTLTVASGVKEATARWEETLPSHVKLSEQYDASISIEEKIFDTLSRISGSAMLLMLLILLINRHWKYTLIVGGSLLVNVLTSIIFFYLLDVQLNNFSFMAVVISLGIVIDNVIVMADHYRIHRDTYAFRAVLAATLTTVGPLLVFLVTVAFIFPDALVVFKDFIMLLVILLLVSLGVSLWLVPALIEESDLFEKISGRKRFTRNKRRMVQASQWYRYWIMRLYKRRWLAVLMLIWFIGFPTYLIPEEPMEGEELTAKAFNETLGSEWYQESARPVIDQALGGISYQVKMQGAPDRDAEDRLNAGDEVELNIIGRMSAANLELAKRQLQILEDSLVGKPNFKYVEGEARDNRIKVKIIFDKEVKETLYPFEVKQYVENLTSHMHESKWYVLFGNNYWRRMRRDNKITEEEEKKETVVKTMVLEGYDYFKLREYATTLQTRMKEIPEILDVWQGGEQDKLDEQNNLRLNMDEAYIMSKQLSIGEVEDWLQQVSPDRDRELGEAWVDENVQKIVMKAEGEKSMSLWKMSNTMAQANNSNFKLKGAMEIVPDKEDVNRINKRAQQFELKVSFETSLPEEAANNLKLQLEAITNQQMALGYQSGGGEKDPFQGFQEALSGGALLLLILGIFYVILGSCTILMESVMQPLAIMITLPVSYIGAVIAGGIFDVRLEEGMMLAFVVLGGLVVNAAIYIINDYNLLRMKYPKRKAVDCYIKAFQHKLLPVLLTILSTILSFVPFLFTGERDEMFDMAIGTIGGLAFSLITIMFQLPLIFFRRKHISEARKLEAVA
ncbi:efflux RND transporter permease subunit [Algivirga pacifica]|uniref:Efflux RND transporter permease subunit n=1 Tax=Algivirga pacifica TaxID=1162670 RepID=A0ABP9DJE9_9BACT